MSAGRRLIAEKRVALRLESRHVRNDVVGAEAQVMKAAPPLFQESRDRTATVERVHELDMRCRDREECGRSPRRIHILDALAGQPEVFGEPLDRRVEIGNRNCNVIETRYHSSFCHRRGVAPRHRFDALLNAALGILGGAGH